MHILDGFVGGSVNAAAFAVAGVAGAVALARSRHGLGDRQVPLVGMTAAFVFAAQMLNFPVGAGTSGHFLGATFAALLLGPWTACLIMSLVLITQCLFFADGGITALGTNIVNLGVVAVFAGWGVSRLLLALLPRSRATSCAAMGLGAWVSVVAAATACSCELGWSGKPLGVILPTMVGIHAIIGVGEALITVAVVSSILGARPDLLPQLSRTADVEAAS